MLSWRGGSAGWLVAAVVVTACGDDAPADGQGGAGGATVTTGGAGPGGSGPAAGGAGGTGGAPTGGAGPGGAGPGGGGALGHYAFESKLVPGRSAVDYAGQSLRQVLIADLGSYVEGMTAKIDGAMYQPADAKFVVDDLNVRFYAFDSANLGQNPLALTTTPPTKQMVYDDISTGKTLKEKMAGNDAATDHKDWKAQFVGWSDASIAAECGTLPGCGIGSPEALLQAFFAKLGKQAVDRNNGVVPTEPGTTTKIAKVYVTAEGWDLKQLAGKHLLMGVAFSQGTDDYLDDDPADPGKGLLSPNTQDGTKPYSVLEHAWDEAFGYFGAARDYLDYSDDEIAATGMGKPDYQGYHDTNGDGAIDLESEHNFAASVNCAKRDLGSDASAKTDFSSEAMQGFLDGRKLLAETAGAPLADPELAQLKGHRDKIVAAWEGAIAATLVHYVNQVVGHTDKLLAGGAGYKFLDHAKHWSELKGFALGLQLNPRKKLTDTELAELHQLVGDRPVTKTATMQELTAYKTKLLQARDILAAAYGFADVNVQKW